MELVADGLSLHPQGDIPCSVSLLKGVSGAVSSLFSSETLSTIAVDIKYAQ